MQRGLYICEYSQDVHVWIYVYASGISVYNIYVYIVHYGGLFGCYGILTFWIYLMPNPFLYK